MVKYGVCWNLKYVEYDVEGKDLSPSECPCCVPLCSVYEKKKDGAAVSEENYCVKLKSEILVVEIIHVYCGNFKMQCINDTMCMY